MKKKTWRCFHCDEVFLSAARAREHFGDDQGALAACQLKGVDNDLIAIIRSQERALASYRREDSAILRAWRSKEAEAQMAAVHAEETGFDRGVQAMKRDGWRIEPKIGGVTWILVRDGSIALERCEKKTRVLGVGEWFIPGGKLEGDETTDEALAREFREEWPTMTLEEKWPLPIVEGSAVPPGPRGVFLMRPYLVRAAGDLPSASSEGTPLKMVPIPEALTSPVPQVRMMTAAAVFAASVL